MQLLYFKMLSDIGAKKEKQFADLLTHTAPPCITQYWLLSHGEDDIGLFHTVRSRCHTVADNVRWKPLVRVFPTPIVWRLSTAGWCPRGEWSLQPPRTSLAAFEVLFLFSRGLEWLTDMTSKSPAPSWWPFRSTFMAREVKDFRSCPLPAPFWTQSLSCFWRLACPKFETIWRCESK